MAKPSITTRNSKGEPLDYTELDTNFENLRDATITVSDGVNSTAIDLNGTIEFTAGDNITLTENNGVITIASSAGGNAFANIAVSGQTTVAADSATDTLTLIAGTGITLTTDPTNDAVTITNTGAATAIDNQGEMQTNLDLDGFLIRSTFTRTVGGVTYPAGTLHVDANLTMVGTNRALTVKNIFTDEIYSSQPNATQKSFINFGSGTGSANILTLTSGQTNGTISLLGNLTVKDPGGAPVDTATIVDWLKITMGSTVYYLPLYQ